MNERAVDLTDFLQEREREQVRIEAEIDKCRNKHSYKTLKTAEIALNMRRSQGNPDLAPYQCSICKDFHLTKDKSTVRRYKNRIKMENN